MPKEHGNVLKGDGMFRIDLNEVYVNSLQCVAYKEGPQGQIEFCDARVFQLKESS